MTIFVPVHTAENSVRAAGTPVVAAVGVHESATGSY